MDRVQTPDRATTRGASADLPSTRQATGSLATVTHSRRCGGPTRPPSVQLASATARVDHWAVDSQLRSANRTKILDSAISGASTDTHRRQATHLIAITRCAGIRPLFRPFDGHLASIGSPVGQ
jgi:hypothetical protein